MYVNNATFKKYRIQLHKTRNTTSNNILWSVSVKIRE